MFKHYVSLTKPGIIFGNLIAAAAGFLLASKGENDWQLFILTMLGVITVVGSGCVFNNIVDRDIDGVMQRTKNRVLVRGLLPIRFALIFACLLAFLGFGLLVCFTNTYTVVAALVGFVVYVGLYTLLFKRRSIYSTVIGSVSGACPPIIGYIAVMGGLDIGGAVLFLVFFLWQMPHSYAIAIYRYTDYEKANIPLLPLCNGITTTRYHIIAYIIAFMGAIFLLAQQGYANNYYSIVMTFVGLYWLYIAIAGYSEANAQVWGKKLFIFSVITICCFSLLISVDFTPATFFARGE